MGDNLEQFEPLHAGLAQVVRAIVAFLVEKGHKDVGDVQLFFLGGLALQDRAFQHALKADRLGRFGVLGDRDLLLEVVFHPMPYLIHVGAASAEYALHLVERQSGVQHVLGREVFNGSVSSPRCMRRL